jgi:ribonuclease P protein component
MVGASRRRLTGVDAFETVFRTGRRSEGEYVQLITTAAARPMGRVGFVIGRKALPLAVDRNRVRRMLRAVLRDARPRLDGLDVIVRLKRGAPRTAFPAIVGEASRLIAALGQARVSR